MIMPTKTRAGSEVKVLSLCVFKTVGEAEKRLRFIGFVGCSYVEAQLLTGKRKLGAASSSCAASSPEEGEEGEDDAVEAAADDEQMTGDNDRQIDAM